MYNLIKLVSLLRSFFPLPSSFHPLSLSLVRMADVFCILSLSLSLNVAQCTSGLEFFSLSVSS